MNPYTKMRWVLIAALFMWLPVAVSMFSNGSDFFFTGLTFVGALVLSYIGVEIIGHISDGYARTDRQLAQAKRQIEAIERRKANSPQRRKDDPANEETSE